MNLHQPLFAAALAISTATALAQAPAAPAATPTGHFNIYNTQHDIY